MLDKSNALFINSETAHRVARSVASAGGGKAFVSCWYVRGEIKGYTVSHKGAVMSNDEVTPYV